MRAVPELLHQAPMARVAELHVRRERVGHATHFSSAHGVGLSGEREGSHAGLADAAADQVTVDDAAYLVRARGRLVHSL